MKNIIYYFSGTGNNLAVAKRLAQELGDTDVFPIVTLLKNKIIGSKYTNVVFTVPSYFSHIPPIVEECLKNLEFTDSQRVVTIVGCGGNRGRATEDLRQLIENCRKTVSNEFMLILPGNYILSYNAFPAWYQKVTVKGCYRKIRKIGKIIKSGSDSKPLGKGLFYSSRQEALLREAIGKFGGTGSQYEVSSKCVQCGRCVNICPVNNISMEEGKVLFGSACQQCMACIQWCPEKAIDYKGIAMRRKRYHHPDISYKDMIEYGKMV